MKLSTYLRLAAEVMHRARAAETVGMCWAALATRPIAVDQGATPGQADRLCDRTHMLLERYRPDAVWYHAYWGRNWGFDGLGQFSRHRAKRCRVLFLLFLAAMEETNERARSRTR